MCTAADPAESFTARCRAAGFDIVHAFSVNWFNESAEEELSLPDFGRLGALGLVVGNSRSLWPVFVHAYHDDPRLRDAEHPLDQYVLRSIVEAATCIDAEHIILWAHDTLPRAIPIQRIAEGAGLARLSPSLLSIHPKFGPWIALRAVLILNADGPRARRSEVRDPCTACAKPCVNALDRAIEETRSLDGRVVGKHWALWARVREVCPEGTEHRYDTGQIRYYYAKDRTVLDLGESSVDCDRV